MSYEMNMTFEGEFLRFEVTGQDSYDSSLKFFTDVAAACKKYDCKKILGVSNMAPLSVIDAYNHSIILKETGFTSEHRIAWVEKNPQARKVDMFIEDVLINRAIVQVKVFSAESEAKEWLK